MPVGMKLIRIDYQGFSQGVLIVFFLFTFHKCGMITISKSHKEGAGYPVQQYFRNGGQYAAGQAEPPDRRIGPSCLCQVRGVESRRQH